MGSQFPSSTTLCTRLLCIFFYFKSFLLGRDCSEILGRCAPGVCGNGSCVAVSTIAYRCECHPGYSGTKCETYLDVCDPNPCENSGTCVEVSRDYTCLCQPGFTGKVTVIMIDEGFEGVTRVISHVLKGISRGGATTVDVLVVLRRQGWAGRGKYGFIVPLRIPHNTQTYVTHTGHTHLTPHARSQLLSPGT